MLNSVLQREVGNVAPTAYVSKMPDASKDPLFNDFDSLIEQAVRYQKVSFYHELNEPMQHALGIAALRENKALVIDAAFDDLNPFIVDILESNGSPESLRKFYDYLVTVLLKGNKDHFAHLAYCIDNALEKEEDKQAFQTTYLAHEEKAAYWKEKIP